MRCGGRPCRFLTTLLCSSFFFQAEDGIRYKLVTGVQTCALPIWVIPVHALLLVEREHHQVRVCSTGIGVREQEPVAGAKLCRRGFGGAAGQRAEHVQRDRKSVVEGRGGGQRGGSRDKYSKSECEW